MMSQDPGEVRCPSCGRTTPLAPFCTHCGAVVPEGAAGARPHAMERAELERRIRQRRAQTPFRRGEEAGEAEGRMRGAHAQRFVPEAADRLAHPEASDAEEPARVDYFDERAARRAESDRMSIPPGLGGIPGAALPAASVDWPSRDLAGDAGQPTIDQAPPTTTPPTQDAAPPMRPYPPAPPYVPDAAYQAGAYQAGAYQAGAYQAGAYEQPSGPRDGGGDGDEPGWSGYDDEPPRRGSGGLAIVGFLVLGVAALLGGAFLFAALNGPSPASRQSSSASATASASPSPESGAPNSSQLESPSGSSSPTTSPPPDNFSAKVQPCASSQMGFSGCVDDGSRLSGDQVWVWVGFKNGQASTVLGVTIVNKTTHAAVGDGSLELDQLNGCDPGKTCSGYMQMSFGNLTAGSYEIRVTRDGDPVASTSFSVTA